MASGAAKRYAQAVFSLAKENGTLDRWLEDLAALNDLVSDPRANQMLTSPAVGESDKLKLVDAVLASSQQEARNLAHLLIQRGRIAAIPDIAQIYGAAVLQERGIVIAEVTTAEPLGQAEQAMVQRQLSRMIGKNVQLRLETDPDIIGGVIARVGDQLIDGSVINQLRRLRTRLAARA
jgi:F-type H+-transporting ATPase subunit delta